MPFFTRTALQNLLLTRIYIDIYINPWLLLLPRVASGAPDLDVKCFQFQLDKNCQLKLHIFTSMPN